MDKDYYSLKNQRKRIKERERIEKAKEEFKRLLKNDEFSLTPIWHINRADLDFSYLGDEIPSFLADGNPYCLFWIEREELFNILEPAARITFVKKNLWNDMKHDSDKITKVLMAWYNQKKLIPPILISNGLDSNFLLYDGKHRFAVSNFLEVKRLPIIIEARLEGMLFNLSNNERVEKIS